LFAATKDSDSGRNSYSGHVGSIITKQAEDLFAKLASATKDSDSGRNFYSEHVGSIITKQAKELFAKLAFYSANTFCCSFPLTDFLAREIVSQF
jgi:hypothetical protein